MRAKRFLWRALFRGLNNAARNQRGLDISTPGEHYGFNAPIWIDNAMRNQTHRNRWQLISLVVSEDNNPAGSYLSKDTRRQYKIMADLKREPISILRRDTVM